MYLSKEASELVRLTLRQRFNDEKLPANAKILDYDYDNLLHHIHKFGEQAGFKISPKYFRKMFRTRCQKIIGLEAICKMAAWTLPGVGRHYFLPSPEDCRITYLEIENLVTFDRSYNNSIETENKMLKEQVQELWIKINEIQAKLNST